MEKIFDGCTEEFKKCTCEITDTISSITEVLRSLASGLRGTKRNRVFEKISEKKTGQTNFNWFFSQLLCGY